MELMASLKRPLFIVCLLAILLSVIVIFFLFFQLSVQNTVAPPETRVSIESPTKVPIDLQNLPDLPVDAQALPNSIQTGPVDPVEAVIELKPASSGLPVILKIPVINVVAAIESVGLTADGAMGVPKRQENVAWFNLGPLPGEAGSAVMAGHYGRWKNGRGSVFDNLYKLKPGDKLYVENGKGETVSFVVREIRTFDPQADATDVFSSADGKVHLNLVTCDGVWSEVVGSYSGRLVVFTDKE